MGVEASLDATAASLDCEPAPSSEPVPDTDVDGMTTTRLRWQGCAGGSRLEPLRVLGGGHTWPGGFQYLPVVNVGAQTSDFDANAEILGFFRSAESTPRAP